MAFGVTPDGFVTRTQEGLISDFETAQLATIDPALDVSADQPLGQINGIFGRHVAILWELAQAVYKSNDPDAAEDDALTSIAKLTGTLRGGATYSTVTCTVDLDIGATLISGTNFAHLNGNASVRFTPAADYTSPANGTHTVIFRAENTGAVLAPAGFLNVIATPVVGWNSVTNALDAAVGKPIDDDATLRTNREAQLTAGGSSTVDAIGADVDKVTGVDSVTVFENVGDVVDANGLPPHSFEVLIYDGNPPAASNNAVAQTIWNGKPSGIRAYSSTGDSGTATDRNGAPQTVGFGRVTERLVYLTYDITTGVGYVGDAALKTYVVTKANALFRVAGVDVDVNQLIALPYSLAGVIKVVTLKLGFSASPTLSADLVIGPRELARFDTSRVSVV